MDTGNSRCGQAL